MKSNNADVETALTLEERLKRVKETGDRQAKLVEELKAEVARLWEMVEAPQIEAE